MTERGRAPRWAWTAALGIGAAAVACAPERGTIGALLAQDAERRLVVREVPPGLAAARGGVREGDEVLLVEGRDVRGMTPEQVHRALGGEVDEAVKLTLVRDQRVLRVTLRRTPARRRATAGGRAAGAPEP